MLLHWKFKSSCLNSVGLERDVVGLDAVLNTTVINQKLAHLRNESTEYMIISIQHLSIVS